LRTEDFPFSFSLSLSERERERERVSYYQLERGDLVLSVVLVILVDIVGVAQRALVGSLAANTLVHSRGRVHDYLHGRSTKG
jgi:hypothetical protein